FTNFFGNIMRFSHANQNNLRLKTEFTKLRFYLYIMQLSILIPYPCLSRKTGSGITAGNCRQPAEKIDIVLFIFGWNDLIQTVNHKDSKKSRNDQSRNNQVISRQKFKFLRIDQEL